MPQCNELFDWDLLGSWRCSIVYLVGGGSISVFLVSGKDKMQSPAFSKSHFLLESSQLSFRYQNVLLNRSIDAAVLWQLFQRWQSAGSVL